MAGTTGAAIAVAARVLAKPLLDLYEAGKAKFGSALDRWKNATVQRQLAAKVSSVEQVKTFWQRDKEVPLSSFYYPSRVIFPKSAPRAITSLSDFPRDANFVIQGTVGQGKSIFLRYLCVQELRETGSGRVPVFIELRTIHEGGLILAIKEALDRLGFFISDELFDFYAKSGKLVLLLDAFDELDETAIAKTVSEIEGLAEKYAQLQIIVTSRPLNSIQASRLLRVVALAPLTPSDHPPFLKRIGVPDGEARRVLNAIQGSSSAVAGLLTTPLMMTLLVVVYRAESVIPSDLPEFYERLFQTLFSKHDASKPGYIRKHKCGLGERKLQQLFEAFCFATLQLKFTTKLSPHNFAKCFERAMQYVDFKCELEGFRHDIMRVTCLMQEEGFESHFIHKSVIEFYAASFIRSRNDDAARKFYSQIDHNNWRPWVQVLQFLAQIDRYRFAKYFALPSIRGALTYLGLTPNATGVTNPLDVARRAFPDVVFAFGQEANVMQLRAIGPYRLPGRYLDELSGALTWRFGGGEHLAPAEFTRKYPTAKPTKIGAGASVGVAWEQYLSSEDQKMVFRQISRHVEKLVEERDQLEKFVAAEDRRGARIEL